METAYSGGSGAPNTAEPSPCAHEGYARDLDARRGCAMLGSVRSRRLLLALAFFLALAAGARTAAAQQVDLLLVLAVDASGSIDEAEFRLQRDGLADALASREVLEAIGSGAVGAIAVAMVEWGAPGGAATVVPWRRVEDAASAAALAAEIREAPRSPQSYNAIGDAIAHSQRLVASAPFRAPRAVIDLSGDGPDNRSLVPAPRARDAAVASGITVNALAILGSQVERGEPLDRSYARDVIGGPGAFVAVARDRREFAPAILQKLIREIAGLGVNRAARG
jgi:hypothetical protein